MKKFFDNKLVKAYLRFLMLAFTLVFIATVVNVMYDPGISITDALVAVLVGTGGSSIAILGMGAIGNIDDVSDLYTQGGLIGLEVMLVEISQIDNTQAFPLPNASREVGTIPMKTGEYFTKFYAHDTPVLSATGEANDYTIDPNKEFTLVLADTFRSQVLNYVENKAGAKFILFFRKVETTDWYMVGTYDKPMKFSGYEYKTDKEASVAICKFTNKTIRQFYKYTGAVVTQAPVTVAADATDLAITDNSEYQLTDNTGATALATVSDIASADHGRNITVYGSGGNNPTTIADNTVFILKDGATWTANAGSRIEFRILDNSTLVEVNRVQT